MSWHPEAVTTGVLAAAQALAGTDGVSRFYLAGPTGLALQRGHRISVDLHLFSSENALAGPARAGLKRRLSRLPGFRVREESDGTLHAVIGGVETSFLHYPYPLVRGPLRWKGLRVASLADIGLMKVGAIIGRGTRKDFRDLREIARVYPLERLLRLSARKFPDAEDFLFQAAKALVYFADARAPDPRLLRPEPWEDVQGYFEQEAPRIFRSRLRRRS